jgi:hypothetical protein
LVRKIRLSVYFLIYFKQTALNNWPAGFIRFIKSSPGSRLFVFVFCAESGRKIHLSLSLFNSLFFSHSHTNIHTQNNLSLSSFPYSNSKKQKIIINIKYCNNNNNKKRNVTWLESDLPELGHQSSFQCHPLLVRFHFPIQLSWVASSLASESATTTNATSLKPPPPPPPPPCLLVTTNAMYVTNLRSIVTVFLFHFLFLCSWCGFVVDLKDYVMMDDLLKFRRYF